LKDIKQQKVMNKLAEWEKGMQKVNSDEEKDEDVARV
jgi:hypothetical protein